jgi:serine/threonine protein kinase
MAASFMSLDMPGSPTQAPVLRGRTTYVDPLRSINMTPTSAYLANGPSPTAGGPPSPRLMRATTPRRVSQSPSASSATPRMPRYLTNPEMSMSGSFRSTPTAASSQNFSTFSGASFTSSQASRFGTPMRASTPVSHRGLLINTPPTARLHHGGSRPSSPSASARAGAHSPVLNPSSPLVPSRPISLGLAAAMAGAASSPSSPSYTVSTVSSVGGTRQLLRDLAASWKVRGSENPQAYGQGGYLQAAPGDVLNDRYELIVKLGWGEFSTVWLAHDRKATNLHRTFLAVKIAKCRSDVVRGTKYECYLLAYIRKRVSREAPVACLVDCFETHGRHGDHICMSMPLLGSNMLCVIEQFKAKGRRRRADREIGLVKEITASVLKALAHLESGNILHTDLKPENVLVSSPDAKVFRGISTFCRSRGVLLDGDQLQKLEEGDSRAPMATLADFGLSLLLEPNTSADPSVQAVVSRKELNVPKAGHLRNERGMLIQTREYRAPEVLFGTDFNCRTDVWSLGCMAYEMLTGDFLMDPKKKTNVEKDMDVEHVAMIMQILGPVPNRIATGSGKHVKRMFDANGRFLFADKYAAYPRRSIAAELETFLEPSEAERAAQFIMSCFTYDPSERCHADDLLRHSWLRGITGTGVTLA